MSEDLYRIRGEVHIPDSSVEVMNYYVLQLLDRCGIRKTEKMELAGSEIEVVTHPYMDKKGVVSFNYSIFERKEREIATYDTGTCILKTSDRGYAEYGLTMNMIMALQCLLSDTDCHLMKADDEYPIEGYMNLVLSMVPPRKDIGVNQKRDPDSYYLAYKRFLRDNEDEFLEFWDEDELVLSDLLTNRIGEWKAEFQKGSGVEPEITESLLAGTIHEMYEYWGCRLVDKEFVIEFLEHREDPNYRRAFRLFRDYMDKDLALFPELTRNQAIEWMIKDNRDSHDAVVLSALQSLLVNHNKRRELFGF